MLRRRVISKNDVLLQRLARSGIVTAMRSFPAFLILCATSGLNDAGGLGPLRGHHRRSFPTASERPSTIPEVF